MQLSGQCTVALAHPCSLLACTCQRGIDAPAWIQRYLLPKSRASDTAVDSAAAPVLVGHRRVECSMGDACFPYPSGVRRPCSLPGCQ